MIGLGLSLVGGDIAQASSQFNRNIAPFSRIKSLSFDGTNDRAHFASDTELVEMFGTGDFSISYWTKGPLPTGSTVSHHLADTLYVDGSNLYQLLIGASGPSYSGGANQFHFAIYHNATTEDADAGFFVRYKEDLNGKLLANQWNHILISCTTNASDRTAEVWINGESLGSSTTGGSGDFTSIAFADNANLIGPGARNSLGNVSYQEYKFDDFMVFRSASNDTIASAIYNDAIQLDESSRSNIQAYYKFEGDTTDQTGNNETFKLLGATIVEDAPDGESYALSFDGVNDTASWASGTTLTSLIGAGDFTLSYWVNRGDWNASGSAVTTLLTNALSTSPFKQVQLGGYGQNATSDTDLRNSVQTKVAEGSTVYLDDTSPNFSDISIPQSGWVHIAYVSTAGASSRSGQYYINGSAQTTTANTASNGVDFSSLDAGTAALGAIRIFGSFSSYVDQDIDDIAIFDAALTSSDISNIYNSGAPKDESSRANLVGYWRMEENGNDSSSNSNNLTVSGATFTRDVPTS